MAKRNRKGTGLMDGRGVAIAVIALVSGASFAFGFYVGKITTDVTKEIQIVTVPSETEPVKKNAIGSNLLYTGENGIEPAARQVDG